MPLHSVSASWNPAPAPANPTATSPFEPSRWPPTKSTPPEASTDASSNSSSKTPSANAQDAITAFQKLTDVDGVKIILGTSCSGAMLGAAPLAEAESVILFSGLASNADIAEAGDYIFRTQISDIEVGISAGNVLWADGIRNLATITEETDYAEGVRRSSVAQFEKNGGRIVAEETILLRHHRLQDPDHQAV